MRSLLDLLLLLLLLLCLLGRLLLLRCSCMQWRSTGRRRGCGLLPVGAAAHPTAALPLGLHHLQTSIVV